MGITTDNSSSSKVFIEELAGSLPPNHLILHDAHLHHVRCFTNVLNIMAEEVLREMSSSLEGLRVAIGISQSDDMMATFLSNCEEMNIQIEREASSFDVSTNWNSTYDMIESSLPYLPV